MIDYEWLILERQESEAEDCATCPYNPKRNNGKLCNNECMEITELDCPWLPKERR